MQESDSTSRLPRAIAAETHCLVAHSGGIDLGSADGMFSVTLETLPGTTANVWALRHGSQLIALISCSHPDWVGERIIELCRAWSRRRRAT